MKKSSVSHTRKTAGMIVLIILLATFGIIYFLYPFKQTLVTEDHNGDGQPDVWVHFNEAGDVQRIEHDDDFDGTVDRLFYVRGQNDQGIYLWEKTEAYLVDQDGVRHLTVSHFDETGRLSKLERDSNNDGKIDAVSHYRDGQEPAYEIREDRDFDGTFEIVTSPSADADALPAVEK